MYRHSVRFDGVSRSSETSSTKLYTFLPHITLTACERGVSGAEKRSGAVTKVSGLRGEVSLHQQSCGTEVVGAGAVI